MKFTIEIDVFGQFYQTAYNSFTNYMTLVGIKCGTCKNGLVYLELPVSDHQRHVTEGGTFKQQTEFVAESTAGNLDRSDAGLTSHVHRLTHHTHLHRDRHHLNHHSPQFKFSRLFNTGITRSRRKAIPMEQDKIRPSVTLYSFDRSLPNLL